MNWREFIQAESQKEYFRSLTNYLQQYGKVTNIFPPHTSIFRAFELCPLDKTKALILGQDPYHGAGQAHGLSFSVQRGTAIPPSLKNIFKELQEDLDITPPGHGFLEEWARQGVLLLNSILTVEENIPKSHGAIGWEVFTDNAIKLLNQQAQPIVHMLWGSSAKTKSSLITNPKHLVLQAAHPSPFSARDGFFGCRHFSKCNAHLVSHGVEAINWQLSP